MRLIAVATLILTCVAAGLAAPESARAQTLSAAETRDIAGARMSGPAIWQGGEGSTWTLYFRPDGVLIYGYDGRSFDNGRWVQNERLVTFHTNSYFAQYSGTLDPAGERLSGAMFNRIGDQGQFRFERVRR